MQKYTLGFVFSAALDRVLLIHKLKPEWQAGKLNGLGGKVEDGEDAASCIAREVLEESGLKTTSADWIFLGRLHAPEWKMDVFAHIYPGEMEDAKSLEKEPIEWHDVNALPENVITNLRWMIPMALEKVQEKMLGHFEVEYR